MAAYLIGDIEVTNPALYDEYRKGVPATIAQYGGRFAVRGGATTQLEGSNLPKRCVVLEFPSMADLKAWYASPEYAPLLDMRTRATRSHIFMVEGV